MKKFVSIISSVALTVGMAASLSANAADAAPEVYFKAKETKGVEVLKSGNVYVNKNAADASGAVVPAEVYLKDPNAAAGWVVVRWASEKAGLSLQNLKEPEKKPYSNYSNEEIVSVKEKADGVKVFSALYFDDKVPSDGKGIQPMKLSGEKSDSYPLATFDAAVDKSAAGSYDIEIYNSNQSFTYVTYRTGDSPEYTPDSAKNKLICSSLHVNVSDRLLGDVNNDGKINAVDASTILTAYANSSTGKSIGLSEAEVASADVDGDNKINAVDASNVLGFYAYQSTSSADKSKSLNNFVQNK